MKKMTFLVVCILCIILCFVGVRQYQTIKLVKDMAASDIVIGILNLNEAIDREYINGNIEEYFPDKYGFVSYSELCAKKVRTAYDIYKWFNTREPYVLDEIIFDVETILLKIKNKRANEKDREDLAKLNDILKVYANRDEVVAGIENRVKHLREKDKIVRFENNYRIR